ncbi:hypothetical protein AALO_G00097410 [Alosa alosa]|uniref:Uncharacterized protein n=1 Tax=Alosa alosa TaxID=278164 RepID=A0AAV6GWM6_9TELE|nr:hypothetical protein AALO_G00097410 [Alosa alosa]
MNAQPTRACVRDSSTVESQGDSPGCLGCRRATQDGPVIARVMPLMFLDWFVPVYLLVSVLVLVGFGACLYFLEPGLQDPHKWSNKSVQRPPLTVARNGKEEEGKVLI